jgi:hypothetical protein
MNNTCLVPCPFRLSRRWLVVAAVLVSLTVFQTDAQETKEDAYLRKQLGTGVSPETYQRALQQWHRIPKGADKSAAKSLVSGVQGTVWKPIGPSPLKLDDGFVNGRVHAIAVHPNNPNVIYQGANIGGVWKTIDGGAHWTPLWDQQPTIGVGQPSAIAIDPNTPDTLYVGANNRFQLSEGILKSTDGGASWIVLGSGFPANNTGNSSALFRGQNVNGIIVEPSNSSILYLASSAGLFRSIDSGNNWTPGGNGGGNVQSLVLDTSSPAANRVLFAGINGSGIRRSTDGGATWQQVLNAATPAVSTALAGGSFGKVVVALPPPAASPNPAGVQVIYATIEGQGTGTPNPLGIFRSTDQGGTWTQRTGTGLGSCQCGFTMQMGVDPASPGDGANDILLWGGTTQHRSTDSGNTWTDVSNGQHVDTRAEWAFVRPPGGPTTIYTGNDGGLYRSTDDGAHWTGTGLAGAPPTINAGGLQTALIYHMDVKRNATASETLGSFQDNGSGITTGIPLWTVRTGGDGFDVAWDFISTDQAFEMHNVSGTSDGVFKSTDGGGSFGANITDGIAVNDLGIFANQINIDPSNAGHVYVSGSSNGLWRSKDAANFSLVATFPGGVGAVDVAPANSNYVVLGAASTRVFVSVNAFAATPTFTDITRNLPGRGVAQVAFDPNDPGVIYATLGGTGGGHVFRTSIGATAWTDISPALDIPFDAIALDGGATPTTIYVGSDLGVLRSVDSGASWTTLDDIHFPNIPVTDLKINSQAKVLRASTFGRGAFELALPSGPVIAVNAEEGLAFGNGCAGQTEYLKIQVYNVGTEDLIVNSVQRLMGSTDFSVLPNPATPILISPNSEVDFTVRYTPSSSGPQQALIRIASSDPDAPYFDLMATGNGTNARIATIIANSGNFGNVCVGSFKDLNLTINNEGGCDLLITNITSNSGQFIVPGVMSYPLVIHPGDSLALPIRFQPTTPGAKPGMIFIASNDPQVPSKIVNVSGTAPTGDIRLTGSTDFGDVCAGTLAEKTIHLCNVGLCDLRVFNVSVDCPDFTIVNNPFPAAVSHDFCVPVVIRFTPTTCGPKTCTLTIISDDPDSPTNTLTLTANTPCPEIDVPPDLGFLPEVIQTVGTCKSYEPFPISNKGKCNLIITAITIGGTDAGDFALSGLPSFPIILQPGHIAGEGDLNVVFAPTVVDRDREATITVTYVIDPVLGTTTQVTRKLCGEGVRTGARVLVTHNGIPVAKVEKIQLQRINANRNRNRLDSLDNSLNLLLQTVAPALPCPPFQYHREYGTVSNPVQLLPGAYQVTATAIINGKRKTLVVGFDLQTCDFNPTVVVDF